MARYNDLSPHVENWTNAKLMREARRLANLEGFGASLPESCPPLGGWMTDHGDAIREATAPYRDSWLTPVLDEIERRFVKSRPAA